jgi:hypothetical protein
MKRFALLMGAVALAIVGTVATASAKDPVWICACPGHLSKTPWPTGQDVTCHRNFELPCSLEGTCEDGPIVAPFCTENLNCKIKKVPSMKTAMRAFRLGAPGGTLCDCGTPPAKFDSQGNCTD